MQYKHSKQVLKVEENSAWSGLNINTSKSKTIIVSGEKTKKPEKLSVLTLSKRVQRNSIQCKFCWVHERFSGINGSLTNSGG